MFFCASAPKLIVKQYNMAIGRQGLAARFLCAVEFRVV